MLYAVKTVHDDGTVKDEIVNHNGPYSISPKNIKSCSVNVFKYRHEHIFPPTLFISHLDGKKYIIPTWIEVHPETTIDDVLWIKPKLKKEVNEVKGSMGIYKTTYDPNKKTYKCTCMGFWRSKGNCKHVKALKEKNNKQ